MAANPRSYVMSDENFEFIRSLVTGKTGIMISPRKRDMVYNRLTRRLKNLGLDGFESYCNLLRNGNEEELIECTNALTTNVTHFFRENHHFEYLAETCLPHLFEKHATDRRIRIWSAGCSSGEEPYTIAMVVRENFPVGEAWDVKILATDLDSNVLERASKGVYDLEKMNGTVSDERLSRFFQRGTGENANLVRVRREIRDLITFRQLNLMDPNWPMRGPFDVIFCRNVVIYFEKDTQRVLFDRYADLLDDEDGLQFIGHSESLYNVTERLQPIGKSIYRKVR